MSPGLRNTLHEFAQGQLHSGSAAGPTVSNPKQAVAIALSEGRKAGEKVAPKPKRKSALHHHAKVGDALKRGDTAGAMHHIGHMMAAIKNGSSTAGTPPVQEGGEPDEPVVETAPSTPTPFASMRSRLSGLNGAKA